MGATSQMAPHRGKQEKRVGCEETEVGSLTETSMSPSQAEAKKHLPCGKVKGHYTGYRIGLRRQGDSKFMTESGKWE